MANASFLSVNRAGRIVIMNLGPVKFFLLAVLVVIMCTASNVKIIQDHTIILVMLREYLKFFPTH